MKYAAASVLIVVLLLPVLSPAARSESRRDLVDTAVAAGEFNTLATALTRAGLLDALRGPGPFTVFAPTDAAFAALPDGTVEALLRPGSRARLQAVLTYHVVPGRIPAADLLPTASATTLEGSALPLGLRVGDATVVKADIECSNGVIHVIDRVLLPPEPVAETSPSERVTGVIHAAIRRGAPLYNDGDIHGCVTTYEAAARVLLHGEALSDLRRMDLRRLLSGEAASPKDRAWDLRHAFDRILADESFEPLLEAPRPEGFPEPGPVGHVVAKEYPQYRAARADGGSSFWTLFNHIKKNDVQMTAPVEMTMNEDTMRPVDMAFLYQAPRQGSAGPQGRVSVVDLEPTTVLSIGMRGSRSAADIEQAKAAIEKRLDADGWRRVGSWRLMGYNSPMVSSAKRFWELQLPVTRTR